MAIILAEDTERLIYLRSHHLTGRRNDLNDTFIDLPFISKLHAVIEWKDPEWSITDLSLNGVCVNGRLIKKNARTRINVGDIIDFSTTGQCNHKVVDLSPPMDVLINIDAPEEFLELEKFTLFPNSSAPEIGVYYDEETQGWMSEVLDHVPSLWDREIERKSGPLSHNDVVFFSDRRWQVFLQSKSMPTALLAGGKKDISELRFEYEISRDREHFKCVMFDGAHRVSLGERAHHELLAYLAEAKLDADKSNSSHGAWRDISTIMDELGLAETHINILLFRARKQLSQVFPTMRGVNQIVQRRRGQLCFKPSRIRIKTGHSLKST